MNTRISFFPDRSQNVLFLEELKEILAKDDSSIAECSIQKSVSNDFCVFLNPKNPQYSFTTTTFNFSHSFSREKKGHPDFYKSLERDGLSRVDIDRLNDLFSQYTFDNHYEALFFASKFFQDDEGKSTYLNLYLKYTENEKKNKHLIDGHKVSRSYSLVDKEDLEDLSESIKVKKSGTLMKCNTYGIQGYDTKSEVLKEFEKRGLKEGGEILVMEHYRDYETLQHYIYKIYNIVNGEMLGDSDFFTM